MGAVRRIVLGIICGLSRSYRFCGRSLSFHFYFICFSEMIIKCLKGLSLLWETLAAKDSRRPSVVVSFIPKPPRHRFPVPRYVKCSDVALYAIGPLFLLPAPFSPHCTLRVFESYCNLVNSHTGQVHCLTYLYVSQYVLKTIPYCPFYVRIPILLVRVYYKYILLTHPPQSDIKYKLYFLVLT